MDGQSLDEYLLGPDSGQLGRRKKGKGKFSPVPSAQMRSVTRSQGRSSDMAPENGSRQRGQPEPEVQQPQLIVGSGEKGGAPPPEEPSNARPRMTSERFEVEMEEFKQSLFVSVSAFHDQTRSAFAKIEARLREFDSRDGNQTAQYTMTQRELDAQQKLLLQQGTLIKEYDAIQAKLDARVTTAERQVANLNRVVQGLVGVVGSKPGDEENPKKLLDLVREHEYAIESLLADGQARAITDEDIDGMIKGYDDMHRRVVQLEKAAGKVKADKQLDDVRRRLLVLELAGEGVLEEAGKRLPPKKSAPPAVALDRA